MPLITVLTHDSAVSAAMNGMATERTHVAGVRSWERLVWLVRERPVVSVVVDSEALPTVARGPTKMLGELQTPLPEPRNRVRFAATSGSARPAATGPRGHLRSGGRQPRRSRQPTCDERFGAPAARSTRALVLRALRADVPQTERRVRSGRRSTARCSVGAPTISRLTPAGHGHISACRLARSRGSRRQGISSSGRSCCTPAAG